MLSRNNHIIIKRAIQVITKRNYVKLYDGLYIIRF